MDQKSKPLKVHAIINPFSGISKKKNIEQQLISAFNSDLYRLTIHKTTHAGHAIYLSETAVKEGADTVIAIGGDGTMNEVAASLIGTNTALGVISMGSGNGFARHMGLHQNVAKSIQIIKENCRELIDTCVINARPYINIAGIGFDAKVAYLTKQNKGRGLWQYISASLQIGFKKNAIEGVICFDDKCISGPFKSIIVANAPLYGFNFNIAPLASLKDGVMDVMIMKEASGLRYLLELPRFMTKQIHKSKLVDAYRATKVNIKLESPAHYHTDGEGFGQEFTNFDIEIKPKSLHVIHNKQENFSL